jgi:hypothetical protein
MDLTEARGRSLSRRRAIRTAGFAALAGGAGLAATSAVAQSPQGNAWPIGTWRVLNVSVSAGANRIEVHQLFVFIPGGVFLIIDSPAERTANLADIPTAVEYVGPFAGQWLIDATGQVRATAIQLNYDGLAALWSEERINYTVTYDAATGTLSGTWSWRETSLDGADILAAQGTVEGSQVVVGS